MWGGFVCMVVFGVMSSVLFFFCEMVINLVF